MSDFHDALRRAAQRHGEAVAPGLAADAVVTSSAHDISRGRRRRSATQTGVGVLGAAVIGVGGWLVLPLAGAGDAEPAGPETEVNAGPWRYEVGTEGDVTDPAVMLRGDDAVVCGDEIDLTPGVTVHDPRAFESELWVEAALTTHGDPFMPIYGDYAPQAEEISSNTPLWNAAVSGDARAIEAIPLLMDGDSVVGIGQGLSGESAAGGEGGWGAGGISVPGHGECDGASNPSTGEPGELLDSVIVTQWWAASDEVTESGGTLLATVVVDPNEPSNTDDPAPEPEPSLTPSMEPVPEPSDEPTPDSATPADLRAPEGDDYQAFVVERPQPDCSPLADLRVAGQPSSSAPEYTVHLPGVTDRLTGELWARGTVATLPDGDDPWFLDHSAWLVADDITDGVRPEAYFEWTGDRELLWGENDSLQGADCAYIQPVPQIDGAVFLVIDGVDWDSVGELSTSLKWTEPENFQTWVYLGEAG